jgi:predicted amidohydrolase YtcJ
MHPENALRPSRSAFLVIRLAIGTRRRRNSFEELYPSNGYYARNAYPFLAVKQAGGVLVAGSDAPVGTWNPIPFVNMGAAVTRRLSSDGWPAQNPSQRVPVRDIIDAYTINGARFVGRDKECGSLEIGKSADFIVLDRDILKLADANQGEKIAVTKVLQTWFMGRSVFQQDGEAAKSSSTSGGDR